MPEYFIESALDDLKNILLMVDRVDINAAENHEWADVEELLNLIKSRATSMIQQLSPDDEEEVKRDDKKKRG